MRDKNVTVELDKKQRFWTPMQLNLYRLFNILQIKKMWEKLLIKRILNTLLYLKIF